MGHLIAEQTTATAVTAALTTLIDWTYTEPFTAQRIIVENTGGGSADDITDVQIDESADGGATSDLDQHAATPAVPIVAGAAAHKTLTSTAKWLRVRAKCTTAEDTTAKAWLMADNMTGMLCTLADLRIRLSFEAGDTTDDQMLYSIMRGVAARFDRFCNRTLIRNTSDATEYYNGDVRRLYLQRYPVISITSVTEALDWDWTSATALTADDDYHLVSAAGALHRVATTWLSGVDSVRVIYQGGYAPAGAILATGETALPIDIVEAALMQCMCNYKRRDDIGLSSASAMGGSISKFSSSELLPDVKDILQKYRRGALL